MKKVLTFVLFITTILGYEDTTPPTLITLKIESSEILTDSEGENDSNPLKNSIKVFNRALRKTNYIEHEYYEIRQVSDTQFEVLGSTLSRAIDKQMDNKQKERQ